jgi:hypothetical protein
MEDNRGDPEGVSKELMPQDAYYKAAQDMMEQAKKAIGNSRALS